MKDKLAHVSLLVIAAVAVLVYLFRRSSAAAAPAAAAAAPAIVGAGTYPNAAAAVPANISVGGSPINLTYNTFTTDGLTPPGAPGAPRATVAPAPAQSTGQAGCGCGGGCDTQAAGTVVNHQKLSNALFEVGRHSVASFRAKVGTA